MLPDLGRLSLLPAAGARTGVLGILDRVLGSPLVMQPPKPESAELVALVDEVKSLKDEAWGFHEAAMKLLFPGEGGDWNKELSRAMVEDASCIATNAEAKAADAERALASAITSAKRGKDVANWQEALEAVRHAALDARGYADDAMNLAESARERLNGLEFTGLINDGLYSVQGVNTTSQEKCPDRGWPPNAGAGSGEWRINEGDDGARANDEGKYVRNPNGELQPVKKGKMITLGEIEQYTDDEARQFRAETVDGATRRDPKDALKAAGQRYRQVRAWLSKFGHDAAVPLHLGMWLCESEIASIDERVRGACVQWARWELRYTTDESLDAKGNPAIWAALMVLQALAERNTLGRVELSTDTSYLDYKASSFYTLAGLVDYMKVFQSETYYDEAYQDAPNTQAARRFDSLLREVGLVVPHKLAWFSAGEINAQKAKAMFLDNLLRRGAAARAADGLGNNAEPDEVARVASAALEDPKSGLATSVLTLEGPRVVQRSTAAPAAAAPAVAHSAGAVAPLRPRPRPTPDPPGRPPPSSLSAKENSCSESQDNEAMAQRQESLERREAVDARARSKVERLKADASLRELAPVRKAGATEERDAAEGPPESAKSASKPAGKRRKADPTSALEKRIHRLVSQVERLEREVPKAKGVHVELLNHALPHARSELASARAELELEQANQAKQAVRDAQ